MVSQFEPIADKNNIPVADFSKFQNKGFYLEFGGNCFEKSATGSLSRPLAHFMTPYLYIL